MDFRNHAFVQDSPDIYARVALAIEDYVPPLLDPSESGEDFAALSSQQRISSDPVTTGLQLVQVAYRLCLAPSIHCVVVDLFYISNG